MRVHRVKINHNGIFCAYGDMMFLIWTHNPVAVSSNKMCVCYYGYEIVYNTSV